MPFSYNDTVASGLTANLTVPFPYISTDHVHVKLNGTLVDDATLVWQSTGVVSLASAPASGVAVRVYRETPRDSLQTSFSTPSVFDPRDLNGAMTQLLYVTQEAFDVGGSNTDELAAITAYVNEAMAAAAESAASAAASLASMQDTIEDATAAATASATASATAAAAASAVAAASSASGASTSASTAGTQATAAASSASTASTQAASATSTYAAFSQRYLGSKTSAPTVDNAGNALITGALYYQSTGSVGLYVYSGSAWAAVGGSGSATKGAITSASGVVDISAISSEYIVVSGDAGPITGFGSSAPAGTMKTLLFTGHPGLTHSATLVSPIGRSITLASGDTMRVVYEGSNAWRILTWFPTTGSDKNQSANGGDRELVGENFPSGENAEGRVLAWVTSLGRFAYRYPKIAFGPCNLSSSTTGPISLTNGSWVPCYSGVPGGGYPTGGFRSGMVQYTPKGRWRFSGNIAISCATVGTTFYARVMQGNQVTNPGQQPMMAVGSPVVVGGGVATCPAANKPFPLPFEAPDILVDTSVDYAAEIWVEVYADGAAGSALAASGVGASTTISCGTTIRFDGLNG